jgi:hypothetical protein
MATPISRPLFLIACATCLFAYGCSSADDTDDEAMAITSEALTGAVQTTGNMTSSGPSVPSGNGNTYYVSVGSGSDSNNGRSTAAPFKTLKKVASLVNPGDVVNVMNGTYHENLFIQRSGKASGYITFRAYPGHHPLITNYNEWGAIQVYGGASYLIIDGLTVIGPAQTITASEAEAQKNNPQNIVTNGDCLATSKTSHHLIIRNNNLSYCGCGGMALTSDYMWVHHNISHHNAFWSPLNCSGLTIGMNGSADSSTATKIFVYDNVFYANQNFICNVTETNPCRITDGEGIIVDTNRKNNYTGRTAIYNNLCF